MRIILILICLLIASCDCFQAVSGFVVDNDSGLPIKGVKVRNIAQYDVDILTNEKGYFEKSEIGSAKNCPEIILRFEKDDYRIDTLNLGSGKDKIVRLKKIKV